MFAEPATLLGAVQSMLAPPDAPINEYPVPPLAGHGAFV